MTSPTERQPAYAFLRALKEKAKRGDIPPYVPDAWRAYLLRLKQRHDFYQ